MWWSEVGRSWNHLICHVHAASCSRTRVSTIVIPVPMILCILRVATDFTSQASMNRQMDQQTDWQTMAGWPRSSTDTIKFASCFWVLFWPCLLLPLTLFLCLYAGPTLLSWRSCTSTAHHPIPPHYKDCYKVKASYLQRHY
jgi:hypothetical protein